MRHWHWTEGETRTYVMVKALSSRMVKALSPKISPKVELLRSELDKRLLANPLKWIRLPDGNIRRLKWNPKQAEFFAAVDSGLWFTIAMIGANQWGKSVAMAAQCVSWISGIPIADWHNTPDELTVAHLGRPKMGWAATTTLKASRGSQQAKFNELLPRAWIRRGVYEKDTGYSKGAVILHNGSCVDFKSEEQGLGEFESETVDFAWVDEVQDMSYALFSKLIARLVAKGGIRLASGLPAAAWVVDLFIDKRITLGEEEGSAAASIYTIHGE